MFYVFVNGFKRITVDVEYKAFIWAEKERIPFERVRLVRVD